MKKETASGNVERLSCLQCGTAVAALIDGKMVPPPEDCYENGQVAVPNLGWFCSQDCASTFEAQHDVAFTRTPGGQVDYYAV